MFVPGGPSDEFVLEATSLELGIEIQSPDASVGDSGLGRGLGLLENATRVHADLLYFCRNEVVIVSDMKILFRRMGSMISENA